MAKRKKYELPSGTLRRQVYSHSEPLLDEKGRNILDKDGKPKMRRVYVSITAPTKKELDLRVAEFKNGKRKVSDTQYLTLKDAIERYIASSDAVLSPSTIRGYRIIQRNAFKSIMDMKLKDITNEKLRVAVNEETKRTTSGNTHKKISPKTVINEYGLVSAVLNLYVPELNCRVKLPQKERNKNEISTPDVIFEMVKGTEIELPVLLAMWLSFSKSEILGLTKSKSISKDGNYITVHDVIVYDQNNKPIEKSTGKKTSRARTHRIPPYIKQLIDNVETDRLVNLSGEALYRRFRRMVIKSGIPYMTFHDLRHVNASVMNMLHIPDKYAQERGGWSSDYVMKDTYMQTFSKERIKVDDTIDSYFEEICNTKCNTDS